MKIIIIKSFISNSIIYICAGSIIQITLTLNFIDGLFVNCFYLNFISKYSLFNILFKQ